MVISALAVSLVFASKYQNSDKIEGGEYYTITVLAKDITTNTEYKPEAITFDAETDQLKNPIQFSYEQVKLEDDQIWMAQGGYGKIYNQYKSTGNEIRGMKSVTIYSTVGSKFTVHWGFETGGVVSYVNSTTANAIDSGWTYDFGNDKPNYFCIDVPNGADAQIDKFVVTYGAECEAGENPYRTINNVNYYKHTDGWYVRGMKVKQANVELVEDINGEDVVGIESNAFSGDTTVKSINLNHIKVIQNSAFWYAENLEDIGSFESVVSFGYNAFQGCGHLGKHVNELTEEVTYDSLHFDSTLQTAGTGVFLGTQFKSLTFSDDCNPSISRSTFSSMPNLQTVVIGAAQKNNAFYAEFTYCPKLSTISSSWSNTDFVTSDNVLYVKYGENWTLRRVAQARPQTTLNIPSNVTYIEDYSCHSCTTLETLKFNSNALTLNGSTFHSCTALTSIDFGGVTQISGYDFASCNALTEVTIPSTLTYVQQKAFTSCLGLEKVIFEEGCTRIDECAFENCTSLTTVVLPTTLTNLGNTGGWSSATNNVFDGCTSLEHIFLRLTSGDYSGNIKDGWHGTIPTHYYSESEVANCWHFDGSGNPVLW